MTCEMYLTPQSFHLRCVQRHMGVIDQGHGTPLQGWAVLQVVVAHIQVWALVRVIVVRLYSLQTLQLIIIRIVLGRSDQVLL